MKKLPYRANLFVKCQSRVGQITLPSVTRRTHVIYCAIPVCGGRNPVKVQIVLRSTCLVPWSYSYCPPRNVSICSRWYADVSAASRVRTSVENRKNSDSHVIVRFSLLHGSSFICRGLIRPFRKATDLVLSLTSVGIALDIHSLYMSRVKYASWSEYMGRYFIFWAFTFTRTDTFDASLWSLGTIVDSSLEGDVSCIYK